MLGTRLATIIATLASLSLSTTFAFGAINPFSSRLGKKKNIMGSGHSSQSSLEQGTSEDVPDKICLQLSASQHSERSQTSYSPPSSPIKPLAHYIFLVHGWLGNDLEMAYLSKAFRRIVSPQTADGDGEEHGDSSGIPNPKRVKRSGSYQTRLLEKQNQEAGQSEEGADAQDSCAEIVVHSVKCNVGKTHDGIRNGGTRLAKEMINFIRSDVQKRLDNEEDDGKNNEAGADHHVTFSLIGNSLGGLYARYAISLLPYQLQLQQQQQNNKISTLHLHPNIFCTTATPHLGVSRHTYLPIPRIAETIIGTGMGETGRDLFRLNSEKDLASAAAGGIMNAAVGGVRRLSTLVPRKDNNEGDTTTRGASEILNSEDYDGKELECVIRNMCLQDRYLAPLRNFRQRIAYANAYGTDFQVPTETAAFLHERSGVGHFVIASRDLPDAAGEEGGVPNNGSAESKRGIEDATAEVEEEGIPPFFVAIVQTKPQSQPQSPRKPISNDTPLADELLQMSQSLDALGWTKVFIDVRDRIPVPGLAKPAWLRPPCGSLDDLIRERAGLSFTSLQSASDTNVESAALDNGDEHTREASSKSTPPKVDTSELILTSQELAQSTHAGDSINFPLGHTVMVANSKNEKYSQLNSQGRPVMDRLAEDMVHDVLEFQ